MNLAHDFVQVWKFSEDQKKKKQMEHFFPQIQVKTKKKVFNKNRTSAVARANVVRGH